MGLFSADCESCGNPILATFNVDRINRWMSEGVSIGNDGSVVIGIYDGYGTLTNKTGEHEGRVGIWTKDKSGPTVWHRACWKVAGSPRDYRGESRSSDDQGHFFDEGTYDIPEPR